MVNVIENFSIDKAIFDESINELKSKGITITDTEDIWKNQDLRYRLLGTVREFSTNSEYQRFLDEKEEAINNYARLLGIPKVEFNVSEELFEISGAITAEKFCQMAITRRKNWFKLKEKYDSEGDKIIANYLSVKFDEAVEKARESNAQVIIFKKKGWNGFRDEYKQARFLDSLKFMKNGGHLKDDLYYKEGISLLVAVIVLKDDMRKSKRKFLSHTNAYTLIFGKSELYWEII